MSQNFSSGAAPNRGKALLGKAVIVLVCLGCLYFVAEALVGTMRARTVTAEGLASAEIQVGEIERKTRRQRSTGAQTTTYTLVAAGPEAMAGRRFKIADDIMGSGTLAALGGATVEVIYDPIAFPGFGGADLYAVSQNGQPVMAFADGQAAHIERRPVWIALAVAAFAALLAYSVLPNIWRKVSAG
jgi:hypothetical protein